MPRLLLSVIAADGETSSCVPLSKKFAARERGHVLTPSVNSSLLLKRFDHNQLFI
jgi:hypothetical protein